MTVSPHPGATRPGWGWVEQRAYRCRASLTLSQGGRGGARGMAPGSPSPLRGRGGWGVRGRTLPRLDGVQRVEAAQVDPPAGDDGRRGELVGQLVDRQP